MNESTADSFYDGMRTCILLFFLSVVVSAAEVHVALVNGLQLSDYGDTLLLQTEEGKKLIADKTAINVKQEAYQRENNLTYSSPYFSEAVIINAAIETKKQLLLSQFINQVVGEKYIMVITDSSFIAVKAPNVVIVDVSQEVIAAINGYLSREPARTHAP